MPRIARKPSAHEGVRGVDRGAHYAFFNGKIIVGPDWKALLGTTFLILIPCIIFLIFVAPYLGEHISWALVAVSCAVIVFDFTMLFRTAFMDPGFYPRSPPNSDVENGLRPTTKEYTINGYIVTTKYCATCCHYRPPRCSHCAVCDNCVDKFDHHCPWIGTCVGRRNYRPFMMFVLGTTFLCCWVFALCIVQLWHAAEYEQGSMSEAFGEYPASIVLIIYVFVFFWFVGGLSALHLFLIAKNMTTYEHFRHRYNSSGNPYSNGLLKNCGEAFCRPLPPRPGSLGDKIDEETAAVVNPLNTDNLQGSNGDALELSKAIKPLTAAGTDGGSPGIPGTINGGVVVDRTTRDTANTSYIEQHPVSYEDYTDDDDSQGDPGRFIVRQGTTWSVDTRVDAEGSMISSIDSGHFQVDVSSPKGLQESSSSQHDNDAVGQGEGQSSGVTMASNAVEEVTTFIERLAGTHDTKSSRDLVSNRGDGGRSTANDVDLELGAASSQPELTPKQRNVLASSTRERDSWASESTYVPEEGINSPGVLRTITSPRPPR